MTITLTFTGETPEDIERQILGWQTPKPRTLKEELEMVTKKAKAQAAHEKAIETLTNERELYYAAAPDPQPQPAPSAPAEPEVSSSEVGLAGSDVGTAETAPGSPAMSYDDDIKPHMLQLSLKKGREAVFKVLGTFDVPNVRDVPVDKWPELLALIDELLGS
jgi:hypothetical protein